MSKRNKQNLQSLLYRSIAINLAGATDKTKAYIDSFTVTGNDIADSNTARQWVINNLTPDMPVKALLDELKQCLPENLATSNKDCLFLLKSWLKKQKKEDRSLFIKRYWNGESIELISVYTKISSDNLRKRICRLLESLKRDLSDNDIGTDEKKLFLLISEFDDDIINKAQHEKWHSSLILHYKKYICFISAFLLCFAFIGAYISRNFLTDSIVYFRNCKYNWEDAGYSYDHLNFEYTHSTSREFGWMWDKLKKENVIPVNSDYRGFECYGYYHEDETLQKLELRWKFLSYRLVGFRQIRATIAPSPNGELPEFFMLPLDDNGEPIPDVTTVTQRDGINIYAATESRATIIPMAYGDKRIRKMIFYKDGLWIELEGINCSPEHMNEMLDWFWDNQIDFSYFPAQRGF